MDQYHLRGKRYSGRAVRVEPLDAMKADRALIDAAKLAGKEATVFEVTKQQYTIGLRQFIKEISDPCENPLDASVKWKKVTPGDLDDMTEYFTSKDMMVLESLYRDYHEVTKQELDDITGKAIPVSSEG